MKTLHKSLTLFVVLAMLLAACRQETPEPTEEEPPKVEATECFVPQQVLVTGVKKDVDDIADELGLETLGEPFSLGYFGEFLPGVPEPPNILPPFQPDQYGNLVTRLYQIADGETVPEVVAEIRDRGVQVFADPNYLTGHPEIMTQGLPWTSQGSPSAFTAPIEANPGDFPDQWAFQQIGLDPSPDFGDGVRVGVFDTLPDTYSQEGIPTIRPNQSTLTTLAPPSSNAVDISDHGPFVVGLVKGVTPASEVQLYQVLNQYGQGTLDVLIEQLNLFIASALADTNSDILAGAVINLSLGLHQCPGESGDGELESLRVLLTGAYRNNIVIVAASGNEFGVSMQIPAAWDIVVGVGASNIVGERACFSNEGNVLAPGGEGDDSDPCVPAVDKCPVDPNDPANCEYGLIGPLSNGSYTYWSGTSFAAPLVSGLAALILAQEGGGGHFKDVFNTSGHWMTATVYRAITCDGDENDRAWAEVHERVINVQESLVKTSEEGCYPDPEIEEPYP